MLFNSYIFVCFFFPICLLGYYGLLHYEQTRAAKVFLVLMSLWFYGYFNVSYLLLMLCSIGFNYAFHRILSRYPRKQWMILAVICNLGALFYFKYFDFFLSTVNAVFGSSFLLHHILLPLGISFFTFQQISFVVDTYHGEVKDCNIVDYALFVSFFPQLIAGPIVNHDEMLPQFAKPRRIPKTEPENTVFWQKFSSGAALFILGLAKKVLLADTFGAGVDYGYSNLSVLGRWDAVLVIIFYTLQLYFDFSGYCDMARGLGRMLGFEIPVNFNSPYKAVNIIDFWKRWHITLNRFFTKYVYIPLGGNRKGMPRMYCNLLLVFFLSGLWHGAGWNYILWGMLHGVLYVITRFWQKSIKPRVSHTQKDSGNPIVTAVSRILLFVYVSVAWVYFRAESVTQANQMLRTAISGAAGKISLDLAECFQLDEFWYVLKVLHLDGLAYSRYILMFVILAVGIYLAMVGANAAERVRKMKYKMISGVVLGGIFVWCILSFSGVSTFLYFNF